MSWLDRLRGKPKDPPLSPREEKIQKIRSKVEDEDFLLEDYIPDDAMAELIQDRIEFGEDLEFPTEPVRSLDSQLDPEWLEKKLEEGKRMKSPDQRKLEELKEKYPYPEVSSLDWSREYGTVMGMVGVVYTQDGKFFNGQGKEVIYEGK